MQHLLIMVTVHINKNQAVNWFDLGSNNMLDQATKKKKILQNRKEPCGFWTETRNQYFSSLFPSLLRLYSATKWSTASTPQKVWKAQEASSWSQVGHYPMDTGLSRLQEDSERQRKPEVSWGLQGGNPEHDLSSWTTTKGHYPLIPLSLTAWT